MRRMGVRRNEQLLEQQDQTLDAFAIEQPNIDVQLDQQRLQEVLEKALQALPLEQREVFTMRENSGMKFEEIAQVLNVSVNTVKSRMRYAVEALRKLIIL